MNEQVTYRLVNAWTFSRIADYLMHPDWDRLGGPDRLAVLVIRGLEDIGAPVTVDAIAEATQLDNETPDVIERLLGCGIIIGDAT